jgi:two-component system KDP operon response regulator KdpE
MKVLVIEDNPEIQEAIDFIFDLHWMESTMIQALTGMEGIRKAEAEKPSLIILDLGLPDIDGLRVLKEIRDFSDVPIIIVTVRGEEMDKIRGLELGADDFIVKPFTHRELIPRARAVLTRTQSYALNQKDNGSTIPVEFSIDFASKTINKKGKQIKLSPIEANILQCLFNNRGNFISSQELLSSVWGEEYMDCSDYLAIHIERLRAKVEENPGNPEIIISDGNSSYKLIAMP